MRCLVFADLQADEGSTRRRSDPGTPLQRWRTEHFYSWAANIVRTHRLDAVWDLGDTTNNRAALAHPTLQVVSRGCEALTRGLARTTCFKLLGNHEQHAKATTTHCGDLFAPYFHVIEDRAVVRVGDLSVVCVSFQYDDAEAAAWIRTTIAAQKACYGLAQRVVVLGHFKVTGARLNSGVATDGVPKEALTAADLVLLGHVHRRQAVGDNGFYVGSPFQQDFGEADDPTKAVLILDTDTLATTWVQPPGFPRYRTITVDELASAARGDDVLSVTIRNAAEAERFYAAPEAASAEPVYAFTEVTRPDVVATPTALTFEAMVRHQVAQAPLTDVDPEDLVRAGLALQ